MKKEDKIYVANHLTPLGDVIVKQLKSRGFENVVIRTHSQLDIVSQEEAEAFFRLEEPSYVIYVDNTGPDACCKNENRGKIQYEDLMKQVNIVHQAYKSGVEKLLLLGCSCIYPQNEMQPVKEDILSASPPGFLFGPYSIAKVFAMKMCENYNLQYGTNFHTMIYPDLYGLDDTFNLENAHLLQCVIQKISLGKFLEANNWDAIREMLDKNPIKGVGGTALKDDILAVLSKQGIVSSVYKPGESSDKDLENESSVTVEICCGENEVCDLLWSGDIVDACLYILSNVDYKNLICANSLNRGGENQNLHLNVGTGNPVSIQELAYLVKEKTGFRGNLTFNVDSCKTGCCIPHPPLDVTRLQSLGWRHKMEIGDGIENLLKNLV